MFHVMPNKMEEYKEWGDDESRLTAASRDWMQSGPRAMNEGGEKTGRCRLSKSCPGVLVRTCAHVVCVWELEGCMQFAVPICATRSGQSFQSSKRSQQWSRDISHELKRLNWTDLRSRPRDQSRSLKGVREQKGAGWGEGVGVREWKVGRMKGGKTKKRDSYYRAGCRGRLFSPSSLCGPEDNDWRIGRESELNPPTIMTPQPNTMQCNQSNDHFVLSRP